MLFLTMALVFSLGLTPVWGEEADETDGEDTAMASEQIGNPEDIIDEEAEAGDIENAEENPEVFTHVIQGDPMTEGEAAGILRDWGLLKGDDDGNLMLDTYLTREQMLVIVSRLMGLEEIAKDYDVENMTFNDVPRVGQYQHYIAWAQKNDITRGYSPQVFGFKESLTGWQAVTFFVRTMGYTYVPDDGIMEAATNLGIVRGVNLKLDEPILRGNMALLMYNTIYARCSDGTILGEKIGVIVPEAVEDQTRGNTVGNIVNEGIAAKCGEWIYYSNLADGGRLYKVKEDDTGREKLNDDDSKYINVVDEWIYYQNKTDGDKLYKIKTDGTGRSVLVDDICGSINVVGGWVYYTAGDVRQHQRIRPDGTGREVVNDDCSYELNVVAGHFYYGNLLDGQKLYSMRIDGVNKTALSNEPAYWINADEGWVYYVNTQGEKWNIYKVRTNGEEETKLNDDHSMNVNVDNGWIYYINCSDNDKLYRIKLDGSEKTKVCDDTITQMNIIGEWIYYSSGPDYLGKVKTDGTGMSEVK